MRAIRGAAVLLLLAACAGQQQNYWNREGADEAAFQRSSRSCEQQAAQLAAREQRDAPTSGGGSSGTGYRAPDSRTDPATLNRQRRAERRVRYHYGECMEARGWQRTGPDQGFEGL